MASRVTTSFRVREAGIQRLLHTDIGDLADDINTSAYRIARQIVPIGSGTLLAGIRDEGVSFTRSAAVGTLSCTADHVGFVIGGTGGANVIHGRGKRHPIGAALVGRGVPFGQANKRPGRGGRKPSKMFSQKFRGQEPNNFLARAQDLAMVRNGFQAPIRTIFE